MDKYEYLWMTIRTNHLPGDISGTSKLAYEELLSLDVKALCEVAPVTVKQAEYIVEKRKQIDADREYEKLLISGAKVVTIHDEEYPKKLKNIENRPYALFYYGELPKGKSVAIIGSRNCTEYGRYMAETIALDLGKSGVNVVSGMAYGIDGIAQAYALDGGGGSFAVLGSGVDICYPRANRNLYNRLKMEGGIISEYPIESPAKAENFPLRNRIISGLSDVVLVVEAKLKSGTFITVDYALAQGREIMVVPGRATDPLSVGCNALILQGANPAQSAEDIKRLIEGLPEESFACKNSATSFRTKELKDMVPKKPEKILLEREENMVYSVLDFYSQNTEDIIKALELEVFQVMSALVSLEMKGLIKETGKNSYVKCR